MSKRTTGAAFVLGLLLLFAFVARAARSDPVDSARVKSTVPQGAAMEERSADATEDCGNECMTRMTLEAHLDYIYTQEKKH